ncbi:MAG TPA: class I SAM-dependent RNA methyltransferase [Anaerolineae bacterium]|nr:class I SAM-dependent RNA methyltransferase [Anaerolineae bacterium]HIP70611.1 class I SAM-dependent RNA methyltransferase [Anaerolineae bacterium]
MEKLTLDLTRFANGGWAVGRASRKRTVFVPYAIPDEKVRVGIVAEKKKYLYTRLLQVLKASPDRVEPRCPYFGVCGGCHFQHMRYERQLQAKREVTLDQFERIGNVKNAPVEPTLANPEPWAYRWEIALSPTKEGGLGFWSPVEKQVIPIESCAIARPELLELLQDVDLDLPGLRKLTLRVGDDEALLAAVEVDGVEPPSLEADFPISVAIVLPDRTAASLVGDNFTVQAVKGRDFRVSPGCVFAPSPVGMGLVVDTVLRGAALTGQETVIDAYSGVGALTAFLAEQAAQVIAIEQNPDAVADTAVNLADCNNVSLYEGTVEEILPVLDITCDILVANPPKTGLSREATQQILALRPSRIIYVSSDVATMARDGRKLNRAGYKLVEIQPIDLRPQTYHIDLVGLWERD